MRYYKHNIGDFLADTHYLSNERLAVYTKLVWEYYLQEKPITINDYNEKAYELKTDEPTLSYILHKYFYLDEDIDNEVWRHRRIDDELGKMTSANIQRSETMKNHWKINSDYKINGFDKFWEAYPNKKDKQKAKKAWMKHQPDIVNVLKALVIQKNSEQWKKDKGQFIPLPTTWINGARWEDEVDGKPEVADRLTIGNIIAKKDSSFYAKSTEEQSKLINNYIKENV